MIIMIKIIINNDNYRYNKYKNNINNDNNKYNKYNNNYNNNNNIMRILKNTTG